MIELHPVDHRRGAVGVDEDRVAAAAPPVARHVHVGVGRHDGKLIVLEECRPPFPEPRGDGERPQPDAPRVVQVVGDERAHDADEHHAQPVDGRDVAADAELHPQCDDQD